tara:strand:+ start:374 stop:2146 length:1773 start_codon:yes stop_codon:yes gene_type:complete
MAAADKNITIKFFADGDKDLIKAFKDLATAQGKFNRSSESTKKSTKSLNKSLVDMTIQVKKTGKSWKQLGIDSKTLKMAFNGSRVALDKMNVAMGKGRKRARLLDNTFATLRSQMLLFSFAMSMGIRQLIGFTKEAAKVESMSRAFNTLSGGVESGAVAMDKLKAATNGTMSQFDLFQQANNAMILGITKNSDEMAEMFDIAQRLGNALGVDTRRSVESLITGIGRQSRLMLDNIGIIVKADEAYEAYAAKLGTTVDKLSDVDKKQAFLNATMEAARSKVASLGEETLGSQASFDNLSASLSDATVAMGNNLGIILRLADAMAFLIDKSVEYQDTLKNTSFNVGGFNTQLTMMLDAYLNMKDAQDQTSESTKTNNDINLEGIHIFGSGKQQRDDMIKGLKEQSDAFSLLDPQYEKRIELEKKLTQAVIASSFSQAISYDNAGKAAVAAIRDVISAKVQSMIMSLMEDAIAKFGWLGIPLAATAGAVAGSLVGQAQRHLTMDKFETGGLVGGRRHSQGGTMIEAEQGEFVMSRNAVNAVGIEAMNRINQGGGAGSVNISFSGNVMSQDFIEGEAIPMIKEAIRRGADIGVS